MRTIQMGDKKFVDFADYLPVEQERDRLKEEVIKLTAKIRARATMRLKDVQDDDSLRKQLSAAEERHKRELEKAHDHGWDGAWDCLDDAPGAPMTRQSSFAAFLKSQEKL